jgi:hypothetical protein
MFRERIDQTPFTSEDADFFFQNICAGSMYAGDKSFLATARAMLAHRIPEGETVTIDYTSRNISEVDGFEDLAIARDVLDGVLDAEKRVTVLELTNAETLDRCMGAVRTSAEALGWEPVERVEALFRKSFPVTCYINRELRSSVLLIDRLSLRKWHSVQVVLFRCLPWFFPDENPINDAEKNLVRSLSKDNPSDYLGILRAMSAEFDFEKSRVRRLLTGFESTYERRRIDTCKNEIERKRRQIEDYNTSISSLLTEMRNLNITLLGAMSSMEQRKDDSDLMDYFMVNKNLSIESAEGGCLRFFVKGYLENFDEDEAEACIEKRDSFVSGQNYGNKRIQYEDMKRLLKAVFVDRSIKLRICAAYRFDIGDTISVTGQSNKRYPAEYSTYLPNPHIQGYSCMGAYKKMINDLLLAGDYVGAVVQCEASCFSLNWGDWAVMSNFMEHAYCDAGQYYELPDGSCVDQVGAVEWLKN